MRLKIVTLSYAESLGGFPQQAVDQACAGGALLEVREHFFVHGGVPHLALVLLLDEAAAPGRGKVPDDDPGRELPEVLQALYRTLRTWRNERAKADGVPAYVVLRNSQVAEICRKLPRTLAALREVEGIGEGTAAKYGKDILMGMVERLFRERPLVELIGRIVRHPVPGQAPGRGLPIGNLTSQWLANLYLDGTDHWLKETRRAPGYARYMDDLAIWADSKDFLWELAADLDERLQTLLGLTLKTEATIVAPCGEGMSFLGWRVYPRLLRMRASRLRNTRRLLRRRESECAAGLITEARLQAAVRSMAAPRAFLGHGPPLVRQARKQTADGADDSKSLRDASSSSPSVKSALSAVNSSAATSSNHSAINHSAKSIPSTPIHNDFDPNDFDKNPPSPALAIHFRSSNQPAQNSHAAKSIPALIQNDSAQNDFASIPSRPAMNIEHSNSNIEPPTEAFRTAETRLEPGQPGRELEQRRRVELPGGEPQQERPRQPQRQPGFSSREHGPLPCPGRKGRHDEGKDHGQSHPPHPVSRVAGTKPEAAPPPVIPPPRDHRGGAAAFLSLNVQSSKLEVECSGPRAALDTSPANHPTTGSHRRKSNPHPMP